MLCSAVFLCKFILLSLCISLAGDVAKHMRLKIKSLEQDETGVKNSPKRSCSKFNFLKMYMIKKKEIHDEYVYVS